MTTTDTPRTDAAAFGSMTDSWELEQLSRQLERELAEATAEVEELATKYFDMEAACSDHMAEVERLKEQYESAAESVARMHEAAVGEIRGPIISVIDDIKAVRERAEKAEAEVERLRELLSLEKNGHEGMKKICDKILDSTRKTPSRAWHRANKKIPLK